MTLTKKHKGVLGEIQKVLTSCPSLENYPFYMKVQKLCNSYGKKFVVGKNYTYQLNHFRDSEFLTGTFIGMDGLSYVFRKLDGLPQYGLYDSFSEGEIVSAKLQS